MRRGTAVMVALAAAFPLVIFYPAPSFARSAPPSPVNVGERADPPIIAANGLATFTY